MYSNTVIDDYFDYLGDSKTRTTPITISKSLTPSQKSPPLCSDLSPSLRPFVVPPYVPPLYALFGDYIKIPPSYLPTYITNSSKISLPY